jgi:DNA repair protein RadD
MFTPRPYQSDGITKAIDFFSNDKKDHGLMIYPTGSGKSLIIANIAKELRGKTVVFQPSKEILEQNYAKFISYGYRAGVYSASAGSKLIDDVTFATIGSVAAKHHLFRSFQNIIIDEAHLVNAKDGMYKHFLDSISHAKVLGLTATPYRLTSGFEGAMLEWITTTDARVFSDVLYYIDNSVLFDAGYLAPLKYFAIEAIDRNMLQVKKNGMDFTGDSLRFLYRKINFEKLTAKWANYLLTKRKNCLVFCSLLDEAQKALRYIPGAVLLTGETEKTKRENMLASFKSGDIRCVVNVGVLTTGFDFPALESVLLARSTMSLALYYQIIGRVMRPYTYHDGTKKEGWVIDLGGNVKKFGKIETMKIKRTGRDYSIWNNGRQLTDVTFSKN